MPDTSLNGSALRECVSRFVTGVTVVTFADNGGPRGVTMNSFTAVSAEPPVLSLSIACTARCHDSLLGSPFCVNILGAEQMHLAMLFAGKKVQVSPKWAVDAAVPRLADPLAWMQCQPWRSYDGGDHTLVLGLMVEMGYRDGDALTYGWGRYGRLSGPADI